MGLEALESVAPATEGFSIIQLILRHYYIILLILFLIPSLISSISIAIETQNPSYPLTLLATKVCNSDALLYKDIELLKENPTKLIGMEKPDKSKPISLMKYYWLYFWNVIWEILANLYLITAPFVLIYTIISKLTMISPAKNFLLTSLIGIMFIGIFNLILAIDGLINGNSMIEIPKNIDKFQQYYFIIKETLPFHGGWNLLTHLINL